MYGVIKISRISAEYRDQLSWRCIMKNIFNKQNLNRQPLLVDGGWLFLGWVKPYSSSTASFYSVFSSYSSSSVWYNADTGDDDFPIIYVVWFVDDVDTASLENFVATSKLNGEKARTLQRRMLDGLTAWHNWVKNTDINRGTGDRVGLRTMTAQTYHTGTWWWWLWWLWWWWYWFYYLLSTCLRFPDMFCSV